MQHICSHNNFRNVIIFQFLHLWQSWVCFDCLLFLIAVCIFYFLHFWSFLFNASNYEYHFAECWIFLCFYEYSWTLFWDVVKLVGNGLILLGVFLLRFVHQDQSSIYSRAHYSPLLRQTPPSTLPEALWKVVSRLAGGNHDSQPHVSASYCFL